MTRIIVTPEASLDIDEALDWYSRRDPVLPLKFIEQLDLIFERIHQAPLQFPTIEGGVRRALFRKFPFSAYFTLEHPVDAVVLAVAHQRPHPERWKRR